MHGHGTSSDRYTSHTGEFKFGRPHGQGTLTMDGGELVFVGGWKEGRFHGLMTSFQPGIKIKQHYEDGVLVGESMYMRKEDQTWRPMQINMDALVQGMPKKFRDWTL